MLNHLPKFKLNQGAFPENFHSIHKLFVAGKEKDTKRFGVYAIARASEDVEED